jgi:hypothetical protein
MRTIILGIIMLMNLFSLEIIAQKSALSEKEIRGYNQSLAKKCNRTLKSSTKTVLLFREWKATGDFTIAKGDGFYCLILSYLLPQYVEFIRNVDLVLKNGDTIKLNPNCSCLIMEGGELVTKNYYYHPNFIENIDVNKNDEIPVGASVTTKTSKSYYCYHEVTQKDLQQLAENAIIQINIYYAAVKSSQPIKDKNNINGHLEYKISKKFYSKFSKEASHNALSK